MLEDTNSLDGAQLYRVKVNDLHIQGLTDLYEDSNVEKTENIMETAPCETDPFKPLITQ